MPVDNLSFSRFRNYSQFTVLGKNGTRSLWSLANSASHLFNPFLPVHNITINAHEYVHRAEVFLYGAGDVEFFLLFVR